MDSCPTGTVTGPPPAGPPAREAEALGRDEALELLGSVGLGRIVFTRQALPAVVDRSSGHPLIRVAGL